MSIEVPGTETEIDKLNVLYLGMAPVADRDIIQVEVVVDQTLLVHDPQNLY